MKTSFSNGEDREEIRGFIAQTLGVTPEEISDLESLADVNITGSVTASQNRSKFDSLTLLDLQMELETQYDLVLPNNYELPRTFGDLITDVIRYRPR